MRVARRVEKTSRESHMYEKAYIFCKSNVYRAIVASLLNYSLDALNLSRGDIKEMQDFQDRCLRYIIENVKEYRIIYLEVQTNKKKVFL